MTTNAITLTGQSGLVPDIDTTNSLKHIAKAAAMSGFLSTNATNPVNRIADAFFLVMTGYEIGLRPMAALRMLYVIDGKPTMSARAILSVARSRGVKVKLPDVGYIKTSATVQIKRPDSSEYTSFTYTMKMAQDAGLVEQYNTQTGQVMKGKYNWRKHFREMLLNRAITMGLRFEATEFIEGLYMVEEINPDIEVDETGDPKNDPTRSYQSGSSSPTPAGSASKSNASKSKDDNVIEGVFTDTDTDEGIPDDMLPAWYADTPAGQDAKAWLRTILWNETNQEKQVYEHLMQHPELVQDGAEKYSDIELHNEAFKQAVRDAAATTREALSIGDADDTHDTEEAEEPTDTDTAPDDSTDNAPDPEPDKQADPELLDPETAADIAVDWGLSHPSTYEAIIDEASPARRELSLTLLEAWLGKDPSQYSTPDALRTAILKKFNTGSSDMVCHSIQLDAADDTDDQSGTFIVGRGFCQRQIVYADDIKDYLVDKAGITWAEGVGSGDWQAGETIQLDSKDVLAITVEDGTTLSGAKPVIDEIPF